MMRPRMLLWVGALVLAVTWWHLRIEAPIRTSGLGFPNYDLYSYYYPTVRFAFDEVRHGHLPLWNPYQVAGEPFFANQQHGLLYPLNGLFLLLPPQVAFKWTAIVHVALALVFVAYLGRTVGLSTGATLLTALTFTFGFLPSLIYVRTWLNGAIWLPLELALAIRLFRGEPGARVVPALAAVFACQYVGGYPMYNLLAGYAIGFLALWQSLALLRRRQWHTALRGVAGLAMAVLLACMACAVQLLPMIEMTALSPRRLGSLAPAATDLFASANLGHFLTLFVPFTLSRYVGAAAFPLALCSVLHPRLRASVAFFATLGLLAGALAIGPSTPLYGLYQQLPTSNWFRFPAEFASLFTLAFAVMVGVGADALALRAVKGRSVVWVVAATLVLYVGVARFAPYPSPPSPATREAWAIGVATAVLVLLMTVKPRGLRWAAVLCVAAVDLMLGFANYAIIPDVDSIRFGLAPSVVAFLREHQGLHRTYLHVAPYQSPLLKAGMLHKLFTAADHESLVPSRYTEYAAWAESGGRPAPLFPPQGGFFLDAERKHMKLLDLLGVRFIVAFAQRPFATTAEAAEYRQVFQRDGATVYENPRALPRAFVVGRADLVDPATALGYMSSDAFDPSSMAVVETSAATMTGGVTRAATIEVYEPERVVIRADGDTPGLLILTDQFYPGWDAAVDGNAVPIYCADYIFRAVQLPPGAHTIEFAYRPRSLVVGAWISGLTLAAIIAWAAWTYANAARRPQLPQQSEAASRG